MVTTLQDCEQHWSRWAMRFDLENADNHRVATVDLPFQKRQVAVDYLESVVK
jgi:hypothetical protein